MTHFQIQNVLITVVTTAWLWASDFCNVPHLLSPQCNRSRNIIRSSYLRSTLLLLLYTCTLTQSSSIRSTWCSRCTRWTFVNRTMSSWLLLTLHSSFSFLSNPLCSFSLFEPFSLLLHILLILTSRLLYPTPGLINVLYIFIFLFEWWAYSSNWNTIQIAVFIPNFVTFIAKTVKCRVLDEFYK